MKVKSESEVIQATPWTAAHQASPSMGFSRQEYWSGVPLPSLFFFNIYLFIWLHGVLVEAYELSQPVVCGISVP